MGEEREWQVTVREDAGDDARTDCGLAVAGAAAIGKRRTDELKAEFGSLEMNLRDLPADAANIRPAEGETSEDEREWRPLSASMGEGNPPPAPMAVALVTMDARHKRHAPPYDYDWQWGNVTVAELYRSRGISNLHADTQLHNPSHGAAGLGIIVTATRTATIRVMPHVKYWWTYSVEANSMLSNATVTGGLDLSAWTRGLLVSEVRSVRCFRRRVSVGERRHKSGTGTSALDFQIDFPVRPATRYEVSIGAWLECKAHTGVSLDRAFARGTLKAEIAHVDLYRFASS